MENGYYYVRDKAQPFTKTDWRIGRIKQPYFINDSGILFPLEHHHVIKEIEFGPKVPDGPSDFVSNEVECINCNRLTTAYKTTENNICEHCQIELIPVWNDDKIIFVYYKILATLLTKTKCPNCRKSIIVDNKDKKINCPGCKIELLVVWSENNERLNYIEMNKIESNKQHRRHPARCPNCNILWSVNGLHNELLCPSCNKILVFTFSIDYSEIIKIEIKEEQNNLVDTQICPMYYQKCRKGEQQFNRTVQ